MRTLLSSCRLVLPGNPLRENADVELKRVTAGFVGELIVKPGVLVAVENLFAGDCDNLSRPGFAGDPCTVSHN